MSPRKIRRVAIYARLSLTTEESVSIQRQLEAAEQYAAARGWTVALVKCDDGVSASKVKPESRPGWRAILDAPESYDAVIVWKADRLARRVLDFLHADEALQARGAGLVAVEDPIDMTTAQGRAFATILAVFAEMEAAAISARVAASRPTLLKQGRRAGVRPPYGWMHVPNPDGPGKVLGHDPERIPHVIKAADMIIAGESIAAVARYLSEEGAPRRARKNRTEEKHWPHARVEDLLRNPTLAGMTPYNPGRQPGEKGSGVLRGVDGLPIIFEDVAIMSTDDFRLLQARLDERKIPGGRPRIGAVESLLSGVLECSGCGKKLHRRGTSYGCQNKSCPGRVAVNREQVEQAVEKRFLASVGHLPVIDVVEVAPEQGPRVGDIEDAIREASASLALAETEEEEAEIVARVRDLKRRLREAKDAAPVTVEPTVVEFEAGETFAEVWESSKTANARRALLSRALVSITVAPPTGRGRYATPAEDRLHYDWREGDLLEDFGPGESRGPVSGVEGTVSA